MLLEEIAVIMDPSSGIKFIFMEFVVFIEIISRLPGPCISSYFISTHDLRFDAAFLELARITMFEIARR
jgi:hypothetical protein